MNIAVIVVEANVLYNIGFFFNLIQTVYSKQCNQTNDV